MSLLVHACAQWGPPFFWRTGSTRLDSTRLGSARLGSTRHASPTHMAIKSSSCVHFIFFGACAVKRRRHWRGGLAWPSLSHHGVVAQTNRPCCDKRRVIPEWYTSQVKSKLAGPKAAPLGCKQMKCRILPDQLVYHVKNTKSSLNRIQWPYSKASTIQLSKPFQIQYLSKRCFPSVGRSSACPSSSVVSMQNPASPNVPTARLQHKKRTSILPRRMWQTKVFNPA